MVHWLLEMRLVMVVMMMFYKHHRVGHLFEVSFIKKLGVWLVINMIFPIHHSRFLCSVAKWKVSLLNVTGKFWWVTPSKSYKKDSTTNFMYKLDRSFTFFVTIEEVVQVVWLVWPIPSQKRRDFEKREIFVLLLSADLDRGLIGGWKDFFWPFDLHGVIFGDT